MGVQGGVRRVSVWAAEVQSVWLARGPRVWTPQHVSAQRMAVRQLGITCQGGIIAPSRPAM